MILKRKFYLLVIILGNLAVGHMSLLAREAAFVTNVAQNAPSINTFATKLREVRKSLGLIQAEMAARLNITMLRYIWFETGRSLPGKVEVRHALAAELDITMVDLEAMLRVAKRERRAQAFLKLLSANDVSVTKLEHYVAEGKSYDNLIRMALSREGLTLEKFSQHSGKRGYRVVAPALYHEDLEALSHVLHLDYDLLREAAMFDYILRNYMLAVRSHGELPLPAPLLEVLDRGLELDQQRVAAIVQEEEESFATVLYLAMQAQGYSIKQLNQALSLPHNRVSHWLAHTLFPNAAEITALVRLLHPTAELGEQQQLTATWQHLVHKSRTRNLLNAKLQQLNLTWDDIASYDVATISIIGEALKHAGIGASKFERQHNLPKTTLFYHLQGTRQPHLDNLSVIHRKLQLDYDLAHLQQLAKIERLAWFYQRNVKELGEFLPESEQRHALENVLRIRDAAIAIYLATKKST